MEDQLMKTETIVKQIQELPNGRFFRMKYLTKLPVKAEYSKQGVVILKIVETTARTGVAYNKIKSVIEKMIGKTREEKENKFVESIQNEMNSIKEKLNKAKQERYYISYFTIFTMIGKYLRREFSKI